MNKSNNLILSASVWFFFVLPSYLHADFLNDMNKKVFADPKGDQGLLTALTEATAWVTAIFTFVGVLFLFAAWFQLKKKDVGGLTYTIAAVGGLFLTPVIVKTLRAIAEFGS